MCDLFVESVKRYLNGLFRRVRNILKKKPLASSCLFVHMGQLGSHWTDFHESWYLRTFSKLILEDSSFVKIWQE
jgi:hypothetical protein